MRSLLDQRNVPRGGLAIALGLGVIFAAGAAPVCAAGAQDDPAARAPGHTLYSDPAVPDVSGLWMGTFTIAPGYQPQQPVEEKDRTSWAPWPPPLTPTYRKRADERIAAAKAGRQLGDIGAKCLPFGLPAMFTVGAFPQEIVQTPGAVSVLIYGTFPVMIWTDGRPHPTDLKPSYNGHSTGYWLGDTLHVDTVGILDATPIDSSAHTPHSGKLHIKTTFQRVNNDTMHVTVTLYDDDALTEPMVTTNLWHRKSGPEWQMLDDGSCFENNKNLPDDTGATGFKTY